MKLKHINGYAKDNSNFCKAIIHNIAAKKATMNADVM